MLFNFLQLTAIVFFFTGIYLMCLSGLRSVYIAIFGQVLNTVGCKMSEFLYRMNYLSFTDHKTID